MKRALLLGFLIFTSMTLHAQLYTSGFHATWSVLTPTSDKEFISKTSATGIRIGFTKFLNEKFNVGIEGGYAGLKDYIPRKTYEYPGGAITTDLHNYMYYITVLANAQYVFLQHDKLMPYVSVGAGVAFTEYKIFYNVYGDGDRNSKFVFRPEVGTTFRVKEYAGWALRASVSYDVASNKSTHFDVKNFSGIGVQLGAVFYTD